ncbi:MAG: peptidoglycan editing factor PgeF [Methylotenera sp.]|uniref:peptidoglycan editing factor PgeF n=1 Tax=Methylotenera sp. TaxID=2051956 RepID=UPI00271E6BEE|nr:peptidoglycan editing factor PgeF [Methylotenera sp.]MDO9204294.1 peptidoglycan editing factor PgeF [Methylotenera sp.]MDO9394627.1 peptidoglycan editing factor PgeF [Methylotenera sp.]MDP1522486.1 peptidoglycan editing factor PgeF [Methylotenera sp.]MDP2229864.1 peptidoglycan editing factor PgeF [Methylotenera sp.]MDP3141694.1 peptidoglycan editing factor PgeF [Methylotenera sp.]
MQELNFIIPDWPAPANVKALQTTRIGGVSHAPYASFNLGAHVNDDSIAVAKNRQLLSPYLPSEPVWVNQVHGIDVIDAAKSTCLQSADASFTTKPNVVCVTMTADCLPVLLCDKAGTVVAAVHAGWRGLCDGAIEAAVNKLPVEKSEILAWLGPAIGPNAFEVGDDVREQFIEHDNQAASAFKKHGDKWLCNMYLIAQQRLSKVGVTQIYGGSSNEDFCTYTDEARFFSFRRDNVTGRMASLIWLAE